MRCLRKWADETLREENESLRQQLSVANSRIVIQETEIKLLSDVLSRNHERVKAEKALAVQRIANAERRT